jgi:8-oxo-dGTP pyrophosphatase MutT (NUDIX family)
MAQWIPHVTVACVVEADGRYLMVEEQDKVTGALVFNQPAGHLEEGETLIEAAVRETLEETGWRVAVSAVLGIALHTATRLNVTYYRTTFIAQPLYRDADAKLDPDIHAVHWLDYEAILACSARMRSPLALAMIERHRQGVSYPLDLIHTA